jgi:predicted TPR repeat methyltransferase
LRFLSEQRQIPRLIASERMLRQLKSSGDLIADRRYAYGADLAAQGDHAAAIDLFQQAIERAPRWAPAWFALAKARRKHSDIAGATAAFQECLRLDAGDALGASLELARLDPAMRIETAPAAYVSALFDAYAPGFDDALVERLGYGAPRLVAALIRGKRQEKFARALDLGCGTGLAGEAVRGDVDYLEGVDIAASMLDVARAKRVYDALHHSEMYAYLRSRLLSYDLIVATDVFTYVGDLQPLITAISERLAPGGIAAFTVETADDADWTVRESLRFAHSAAYIRRLADQCGLTMIALENAVIRKDRGDDVAGLAVLFQATDTAN